MSSHHFRVWLYGHSMTASYDGYVDVVIWEDSKEEAIDAAKKKLTGPNGAFSDWNPSMFNVKKVEKQR